MRRTIEKIKERKGITLIALVVTIVIILILAGITVGMVTSDNGILKETKNAKQQAEIDNEKSILERAKMLAMMRSKNGAITYEIFEPALKDEAGANPTDVSDAGDTIEVLFTDSNRYYEVDKDGNVSKPQEVVKDEYAGDITKGGRCDGSEEKPYEINCIEDLVVFSNMTKGTGIKLENGQPITITETNSFKNKNIILTRSLNFKSKYSYIDSTRTDFGNINGDNTDGNSLMTEMTTGTGFTPIGNFGGNFSGESFTISNVYINAIDKNTGLFGTIEDATIKKLTISGSITGTNIKIERMSVGGIVGISNGTDSVIENCINKANVIGKNIGSYGVGGIIGYFIGNEINSCINYGNVISEGICGGIAGTAPSKIYNCINFGDILAKEWSAAGINGGDYWSDTPKIYNCINKGKVETTKDDIYSSSGGIYGYMRNAIPSLEIYNSCNVGKLLSKRSTGSLIAAIRIITPTIKNCYYLKTNQNETLGTDYTEEQMKGDGLLKELNSFIESNTENIDTTGYAKWKKGEDEYPTLDLKIIWDGTKWTENN